MTVGNNVITVGRTNLYGERGLIDMRDATLNYMTNGKGIHVMWTELYEQEGCYSELNDKWQGHTRYMCVCGLIYRCELNGPNLRIHLSKQGLMYCWRGIIIINCGDISFVSKT